MSDFLKKFSSQDYDQQEDTADVKETQNDKLSVMTSSTKDEKFIRDDALVKKNRLKKIVISGLVLAVVVGGGFLYKAVNTVQMPAFSMSKTLDEMKLWATQNKITLRTSYQYSTKMEENYVLEQSIKQGEKISKGSAVDVVVSKGADPEERIKLPDFTTMNLAKIEQWKEENKATGVTIDKEFNDNVEKGKVLAVTFKDSSISAESYRRKDKLTIKISKGKEVFEKNITVPNFEGKLKSEVEAWADKQEVNVTFQEQGSASIPKGTVLSQSIAAKEKVAKKDTIVVTISLGKILYAPNFYGLDETQAQLAASQAGVNVQMVYYYHSTIGVNQLIEQSVPAGQVVEEGNPTITLMYSLGKPYVDNFIEQSEKMMIDAIAEMNRKGANLTYQVVYQNSEEVGKGMVMDSSPLGSFVEIGSHIVIVVSKGK